MKQPLSAAKPLVLSQGDPAGVGPAATLLAWKSLRASPEYAFYLRGRPEYLTRELTPLGLNDVPLEVISSPSEARDVFPHALPVLLSSDYVPVEAGHADIASAPIIISSIENAVNDVVAGHADGVVTNPIAKALLYSAGFSFPGHTEFLAHLAGENFQTLAPRPVMMLVGGGLKVALATIHIPLMTVASALTIDLIRDVGHIVTEDLKTDFGLQAPRLGVCGLNPHAGESGTLGREDLEIITPAIEHLCQMGLNVIGPRPGDTVFHEALTGQYDAVLAMYHDQGLIPVKTLDIWGGVNVTLGLPFIRTSPDHGTGYDAAASRNIKADSLIAAIKLARQMANNRNKMKAEHDG